MDKELQKFQQQQAPAQMRMNAGLKVAPRPVRPTSKTQMLLNQKNRLQRHKRIAWERGNQERRASGLDPIPFSEGEDTEPATPEETDANPPESPDAVTPKVTGTGKTEADLAFDMINKQSAKP